MLIVLLIIYEKDVQLKKQKGFIMILLYATEKYQEQIYCYQIYLYSFTQCSLLMFCYSKRAKERDERKQAAKERKEEAEERKLLETVQVK